MLKRLSGVRIKMANIKYRIYQSKMEKRRETTRSRSEEITSKQFINPRVTCKRAITCSIKATPYTFASTKSDTLSRSPPPKVTRNSRFRTVKGSSEDSSDSPTYMYVVMVILDSRRRSHARRIVGRRFTSAGWNLQATLSCLPSNGV